MEIWTNKYDSVQMEFLCYPYIDPSHAKQIAETSEVGSLKPA
jgi:hypothetical protein